MARSRAAVGPHWWSGSSRTHGAAWQPAAWQVPSVVSGFSRTLVADAGWSRMHMMVFRRVVSASGLIIVVLAALQTHGQSAAEWRQWGGPGRNFMSDATGLADAWPASRTAGLLGAAARARATRRSSSRTAGCSPCTVPAGSVSRTGPWQAEEIVVAIDARTGKTLWEHRYASEPFDFTQGPGPHSTPLVVGERVFATGTNKQVHALDARTGRRRLGT